MLSSSLLSLRMKRDFFSWDVLSSLLSACQSLPPDAELAVFVRSLFSKSPCCLYDALSTFSFASHVPTMIFRVLTALNPFRFAFDRSLYLAILRIHPEVLFLLFADSQPSGNASTGGNRGNGETSMVVERSQSRALIHWILDPRDSEVWFHTIDFLIEVLRLPLALPSDAYTASQTGVGDAFFEQLHTWLMPESISRAVDSRNRGDL